MQEKATMMEIFRHVAWKWVDIVSLMSYVVLGFYVPPTAKVIRRQVLNE